MTSKELVISANRHETRVALLEDDQLVEVYFQRANEYSLAGSIHKGRVTRVLPGMQSAFVDLGLDRDTFLYVSDFLEEHEDFDRITGEERPREERSREERRERGRERRPPQPQAQAVQAAPEAAAEGAPPAEATGAAAPARTEQGGAEQRGEDRRGRRSRRRRGRSRGFPESKYADESPAAAEPSAAEPVVEAEAEEEEKAAVGPAPAPLILPGESLAKYRGSAAGRSGAVPPPLPETEFAGEENGEAEETVQSEYDEPIHYPPENALPDAPEHEQAPAAAAPVAAAPAAPVGPPPAAVTVPAEVPPEEAEDEPGEALLEESESREEEAGREEGEDESQEEGEAAGRPAVAPMLDEDEDRDIQAMILGEVEGGEDGGEEEPTEPAASSLEPGVEGVPPEAPESGAAEVRERGGRYPHRVSRRIRRRMRGQPRPSETAPAETPAEAPATAPAGAERRPQERTVSRPSGQTPSIADLLKEGQEIIVQIAKEPLGQKGARITSHIALPGRYVVYMPTLEHMGVSRKISSDEERLRLKRILQSRRPGPAGGFITRTAAEGRTEEEIAVDMEFLYKLWQDMKQKAERKPAPLLLHHDLDIVQRILRDQLTDSFKAIWIDSEDLYENVVSFVQRFQPALVGKVKLYTREAPIFDAFGITAELEKALRPKVWLKSGGYIVINQTEALVAIDVNTGKFVGKSNRLEDTIVKTNTEAIKEIVRQVRLRDLGGIIVIDFIDMDERKNRQKVMQALEEAMRVDRAPYKILQFNDFGLVAITRKRVKQSLERTLCSPCPHCDGAGYIKSVQTVVSEILTEARKMAPSIEGKDVMLRVHPDVAKVLKSHQNKYLEELEEVLRRPVLIKSDPLLHHEKFDLA
jgi:ribonuclease G